jgi:hypothetical protein
VALRYIWNQPGSLFAIFKSIRRMRKRPARAIDAVAFHQIVQDSPVRLNSLRFGMIRQAAGYFDYQQSQIQRIGTRFAHHPSGQS